MASSVTGAINTVTVGGTTIPLSSLIVLSGATTTSGTVYQTLYKDGSKYTVTSGKTLYIFAARYQSTGASSFNLGYGDTGVDNTTTAPTNAVTKLSGASVGAAGANLYVSSSSYPLNTPTEMSVYFTIPAGKLPYMVTNTAANSYATFYCYEA